MIRRLFFVAALAWLASAPGAGAHEPSEALANPALEARAEAIGRQLRCLVCQNESIEESAAPLAHDLRLLIRDRLVAGDTDKRVIDGIVARYGIFVLLDPPFRPVTYFLWLGPPGLLLAAGLGLTLRVRARRRRFMPPAPGLSETEQARAAELLGDTP